MNIYHNADECPEFLPLNSLVNDKYERVTPKIADGTIDCIIIDPPYTDGKTDALPNHKIQTKISIPHIMQEAHRILKPEGFFVFFGLMPTVVEWLVEAQKVFKYREHITWAKRMLTSPYLPIQRCKEDIFIYAKGKPPYYELLEKFEDLRTPMAHMGLLEFSTMRRYQSDMQARLKNNAKNMIYFQGIGVDNSPVPMPLDVETEESFVNEVMDKLGELSDSLGVDFEELEKSQRENRPLSDRRNDALVHNAFQKTLEKREHSFEDLEKDQKLQIGRGDHNDKTLRYTSKERPKHEFEDLEKGQKLEVAHGKANDKWLENKLPNAARERTKEQAKPHRYESKHWCNLTNMWGFFAEPADVASHILQCTVWSYLTQNQTKMGEQGENWKHPTVKPVKLLKRLIKLLTPEPAKAGYTPVIVDFFNGSGTTTKAAAELGRAFIGVELQPDYFAMTVARTDAALKGEQILSKDVAIASTQPVMPQQQKLF